MIRTAPVPQLVPVPREQFLRKEETRLRSAALLAAKTNADVAVHFEIILMAEDLADVHQIAAQKFARQDAKAIATAHDRFALQAFQIRLFHLEKISRLLDPKITNNTPS